MSRFKRGGHLVRSNVQRDVLLRFVLHWVGLGVLYFAVVFCMHFFLGDPSETVPSILRQMWERYSLLVVVTFAMVPYFMYDLIKLTHRFAGPMVRFGNALHRSALGEMVEPIHFRKGDYWQEIADDFNIVLQRIPHDHEPVAADSPETMKCDAAADMQAELVEV